MIKVDIAHTYAIAGYGKDELASTLVFLAVRCSVFGAGNFEHQLDLAYADFKRYCMSTGKRTTIDDFSKQELKIKSFLDFKRLLLYIVHACCTEGMHILLHAYILHISLGSLKE